MPQVAATGSVRTRLARPRGLGASAPRDLPGRMDLAGLFALGQRTQASRTWPLDGDLAHARNAHATNSATELQSALAGSYDWLEVDVRRVEGALVASHDRRPAPDALRMEDWVRIGAASRRGLKLDFKERGAIAPTLDLVAAAGVPDARLVINVPILGDGGLSLDQLRRIRARFPRATINLSLSSPTLDAARIRTAVDLARRLGGPVAFPLDLARADRATIAALRAGGRVAIWNDPRRTPVRDVDSVRRALRRMGADGTIDLR